MEDNIAMTKPNLLWMWWTLIVWGFFSLVDFDCEDCKKVTDNVIHTTHWLLNMLMFSWIKTRKDVKQNQQR